MTTKFVGASGENGREREVVPVPEGMTEVKEVMHFFQCDWRTAKATLERGFYIVGYHRRSVYPGVLEPDAAYGLVWSIYRRKYLDRLPWYVAPEDLVQEGVMRLLEMAGHPRFQERGFQFYLALNAMKGWIDRQRRQRGGVGGTLPGFDENFRPEAWSAFQTGWQAQRDEAPDRGRARVNRTGRSTELGGKITRPIGEAGEGISQEGLGRCAKLSPRCPAKKAA